MQLMPGTAADVARALKLPKPNTADLVQASTNIRLGSNYLKQTLDSLGNTVLATAALQCRAGTRTPMVAGGQADTHTVVGRHHPLQRDTRLCAQCAGLRHHL